MESENQQVKVDKSQDVEVENSTQEEPETPRSLGEVMDEVVLPGLEVEELPIFTTEYFFPVNFKTTHKPEALNKKSLDALTLDSNTRLKYDELIKKEVVIKLFKLSDPVNDSELQIEERYQTQYEIVAYQNGSTRLTGDRLDADFKLI